MSTLNVDDFTATASLFPIKLYRMVCDAQCQCMTWGGEGEHLILNTRGFEDELLQQTIARWKYQLKTTSTTSFIRQLHAYGFRKVVEGFGEPNNIRRYYHPYFHRQRPDLLVYMKRSMRSSGGAKKHPLRILDESNRQMLMSSILNQSFTGFDKLNFPAETSFSQLKCGETSQSGEESANKRRRKAPPRKHPSFEETCDWDEDDGECSPPSMVPRFRYKDNQLPRMYPMVMGNDSYAQDSMSVVKQEGNNETMTLQNVFPRELKQAYSVNELPVADKKISLIKSGKIAHNQSVEKDPEALVKNPKVETVAKFDQTLASDPTVNQYLKKELNNSDSDEPLDLSLPRASPSFSEKYLAPEATKSMIPMHPQMQKMPGITIDDLNHKPSPTYDCSVKSASVMDSNIALSQNISNNKLTYPVPGPMGGKTVAHGLPPFPSLNTRITVPPHSILQPAYIAWPTRGIFCPQTKQWIQSRPSIIPLPYRSQQPSPGKPGPIGPKLNGNALPVPWCHDLTKGMQEVKDIPIKTEPNSGGPEESPSPAVHALV